VRLLKRRRIPKGLSLSRACKLLKVSRSVVYYNARGEPEENLRLMEKIEEIYQEDPTLGYRRMAARLSREMGIKINPKRVLRLMRKMGLKGICPAPRTTRGVDISYPNLLERFSVSRPNQVWCADITYIRAKGGFAYGVAIMDMYSRKILAFEISNTMDKWMCVEAAKKALARYGKPKVIHTDRGKQFVGKSFTALFEDAGVSISVGSRGFRDNLLIERFWRSLKWECVYLRDRMGLKELKEVTKEWVEYYNSERPHQSLGYKTPDEVYYGLDCKEVAA